MKRDISIPNTNRPKEFSTTARLRFEQRARISERAVAALPARLVFGDEHGIEQAEAHCELARPRFRRRVHTAGAGNAVSSFLTAN